MNNSCKYKNGNFYNVELELSNGDMIVRAFDRSKLYSFRQITCYEYKFCTKFPFIKREKIIRTKFRYQDEYETMRSSGDSRFCVNCSLTALMDLFEFNCSSWAETVLKDAIRNG